MSCYERLVIFVFVLDTRDIRYETFYATPRKRKKMCFNCNVLKKCTKMVSDHWRTFQFSNFQHFNAFKTLSKTAVYSNIIIKFKIGFYWKLRTIGVNRFSKQLIFIYYFSFCAINFTRLFVVKDLCETRLLAFAIA